MGSLTRVIITLGTGFVLYLMAVLFHQGKHLTQIITPLHIMAAILQASGLGVLLNEYFPSSQVWQHGALFVVGLMLLQQIFTFLGQRLNVLLFSSVFFITCFLNILLDLYRVPSEWNNLIVGGILFAGITAL